MAFGSGGYTHSADMVLRFQPYGCGTTSNSAPAGGSLVGYFTLTGAGRSVLVSSPSWPFPLLPQAQATPSSLRARE